MPQFGDSPSVSEIIEGMTQKRGALVTRLRDHTLALEDVEERTLFDHFCREWTPAYYVRRTQLFHVHDFQRGLRATMFVGVKTLEPVMAESPGISAHNHRLVAETPAPGNTKSLRVPIGSHEDVDGFMELVRVKWTVARGRPARTP